MGLKVESQFIWIVISILVIINQVYSQGVYHEVEEEPCDVTIRLNQTVELVCSTANTDFKQDPYICSVDQIIWRKRRLSSVSNVYTSDRLSIWESVSMYDRDIEEPSVQQVSILRIEHFITDDIGRYECHVITTCNDVTLPVYYKGADLCYNDPSMKGVRCSLILHEDHMCDKVFHDGHCDAKCDTMTTLYDGYDCAGPVPRCQTPRCDQFYMDGICHTQCNTASCLWDGGDCIITTLDLTHDALVLDYEHAHHLAFEGDARKIQKTNKELSQHFSQMLRGLVRVIPVRDEGDIKLTLGGGTKGTKVEKSESPSGQVMLRLDNSLCEQRCFSNSEHLARYLSVYNTWLKAVDKDIYMPLITVLKYHRDQCSTTTKHSIHRKFQIFKSSDTLSDPSSNPGRSWVNTNLLLITSFLGATLIVILLIAVVTLLICIRHEQRKHSQRKVYTSEVAKTWLFGDGV